MKFITKIIDELLSENVDLSGFNIILPGKRPVVFIKRNLEERGYEGMLPNFFTIEELIQNISQSVEIKGVSLWLFAYSVYLEVFSGEDFSSFLKWYPTLQKDWDDILKFSEDDKEVLEYMLNDERIKNWGETLNSDETALKKNLNFWKKMNVFLPILKKKLEEKGWATAGMQHKSVRDKISDFVINTNEKWVFCGFNAFTPTEERLVRELLGQGKAWCYFQADEYYINDTRQEAGKFLREHKKWKEFNDFRPFTWVDEDFAQPKKIKTYEVSGNVSQTKILPQIFEEIADEKMSDTALVLLDENLLPATLDTLSSCEKINITMGFPLKNLSFSNAIKKIFYIQKQQEKKKGAYYYNDVLSVLDSVPKNDADEKIIRQFSKEIKQKNIIYLSENKLNELLKDLAYISVFHSPNSALDFLDNLLEFCNYLKNSGLDDIQYENISYFEKSFRIIKNQISEYHFEIKMETLEVLINQLVNLETIDFKGEPLEGLQIMGLLETRLLNFKNIILLSTNEGKLPLGNTQNTYLPFDVRERFGLHTFLENDSIYAYHFYRLLQGAESIYLLYNALSSGVNTGEKSRFITQIEMESPHNVEKVVIENTSEPVSSEVMEIEKTASVLEALEKWKGRISASSLTSYLYDPIQFYFNNILGVKEESEVEEELSQRNYGNLVHYSLEYLYGKMIGKNLEIIDIENALQEIDIAMDFAINKLNHQPEYYAIGMNFIHKNLAKKVVESILNYDLNLLKQGDKLEILFIEKRIEGVEFQLSNGNEVSFVGFIDRIDRLNGELRVIDYKTAKVKNIVLKPKKGEETIVLDEKYKQALQLCIYLYYIYKGSDYQGEIAKAGIWSFAEVERGVQSLVFDGYSLNEAMEAIGNLIEKILNPNETFKESEKIDFGF